MTANRDVVWLSALDGQPRRHPVEPAARGQERDVTFDASDAGTAPPAEPPAPFGWTDGLAEMGGPRLWERVVAAEQARNARHARTSTIVLLEVAGFGHAVSLWGAAVATRLFVEVARVIAEEVRASDHCARIGPSRFGILLTETDEISAINCVDRIQARCATEFDPARNCLRVVGGWASPEVGGRLADAQRVAAQRLEMALAREA